MIRNVVKFTIVGFLGLNNALAESKEEKSGDNQPSKELVTFLNQVRNAPPKNLDRMFTLQADHLNKMCDEMKKLGTKLESDERFTSLGLKGKIIQDKCASLSK